MQPDLLKAIELALAGEWAQAHNIVQQHEEDATAAWLHAVLHKMEGDLSNSRYWYRRAGKIEHAEDEARGELTLIRSELSAA